MNKKNSLEVKIEKAVQSSFVSKKTTKELIEDISLNQDMNRFFNQLKNNPKCKKLLFLHRFDLFGIEDEMQLPYLHLCNLKIRESEVLPEPTSTALQYVVSEEIDVGHNIDMLIQSTLGINHDKWDILADDFKDIIAYFLILCIRNNPNIRKLITSKKFDYKIMKNTLKDYSDTINFDIIGRETKLLLEGEPSNIDPVIQSKIENTLVKIIAEIIKNIEPVLESTNKIVPNLIYAMHLSSNIWLTKILSRSNLTFYDYINTLDELYRNHLIDNKSTIFWCENCNVENPSHNEFHGRIAPSKLSRGTCLTCEKAQSYNAVFSIDRTLKDALLSKDGILPVYFGWLLKKENIEFNVGEYSNQFENDFVIKNSILVECKMFKSEKDSLAIRSEIENSLSQIIKHIEQLESEGQEIEQAYFLWNRCSNEMDLQKKLRTKAKFKELFKKYHLKIICPDEIEEIVEEMK